MNTFEYRSGELHCENVRVADIAQRFGTPVWIYSKAKLLHEFQAIKTGFAELEPVICYSVKANSNLSLLKVLNEAGSSFDVVSGGELYRVQRAGADTTRVVFAGVGKTDAEIRQALESNILMFNVESEGELDAISAVAKSMNRVAPVAMRLNLISMVRRTRRPRPARRETSSAWISSGTTSWLRRSWPIRIWSCAASTCISDRRS